MTEKIHMSTPAQESVESDFERVFRDACDEAGCGYDNELLLTTIKEMRDELQMRRIGEALYPSAQPPAAPVDTERRCQKCRETTKSEEALVDGQIWCHPCADAAPLSCSSAANGDDLSKRLRRFAASSDDFTIDEFGLLLDAANELERIRAVPQGVVTVDNSLAATTPAPPLPRPEQP